jgi:hypothetical protein
MPDYISNALQRTTTGFPQKDLITDKWWVKTL